MVAGVEVVKGKKDGPLAKNQKMFENAWWDSGAKDDNGAPYLTRSDLIKKLTSDGMADRTIQNMLNSSYDNKLIGALLLANSIKKQVDGWVVIDDVWASAMIVSRTAK